MNDDVEAGLRARVAELEAEVAALRAQLADPAPDAATGHLGLGEGERRNVTVLFADVSGFTALGERLDAESYRAVVRDTMATLAGCVVAEGGVVEKFIGDAVCAVFGAPVAHPDEPQRAARASLAMHEAMAERSASRPGEPPIGIHVGINTGLVIAGGMGDGSQFGVLGDTVNTAARLLNLATEGETFVAAETARRLRREFVLEDRGVHELKGKAVPVAAFALLGTRPAPEGPGGLGAAPALVGRDAELAALRDMVGRLDPGQGMAIGIIGPPGSGTSRLARAFAAELLMSGRDVEVVEVDDGAAPAAATEGTASGSAITLLAGRAVPAGAEGLSVVELGPLPDAAVADLFEALLPHALDPDERLALARRAEGNPLFAEEIAHALVDEGLVVEVDDGWRAVGDIRSCAVPASVTELVEARIDALPTAARAVLQDLALIGGLASADTLRQVAAAPAGVDAALADLATAGLASGEPGGTTWVVASRLVREVTLSSMLQATREAAEARLRDHGPA